MKILLDTHILLWIIAGNDNLSTNAMDYFLNEHNQLFFSAVSYWEICVKQNIGKLKLSLKWDKIIDKEMLVNDITWLPIEKSHCIGLKSLPFLHRDPFDRLLVSQAKYEGMKILTADKTIAQYDIEVIC